ncbi:hypothetical protein GGX14DRAFT_425757 [Mycena pura]|uniref:Uncharacterized protein n=1 Tax=Mycena pura TaxID=153505 RepID=A0AAD6YNF3_9AGAR|nr:hypothetical protein GGX14DRAFT_425757 [Mycena pura]
MDSLPIDMNHPAVRDYLALVRLQVLTPLSLLINIASVAICIALVNPSMRIISKLHPTSISPQPSVIFAYVAVMYLGQIGHCVLLILARKPETKSALIKGVGPSLVFANWLMALWAIAWVFEWFIAATVLAGLLLIFLLYSNTVLLIYHAPTRSRPFDTALIHAPLRFFCVIQFALVLPLTLFIALGLTYTPMYNGTPIDYNAHRWSGLGVVLGTNLVSLLVIVLRRDIVWCIAATWICISIWSLRPKPQTVYLTTIVFTAIHPLALVAAYVHAYFYARSAVDGPDSTANGRGAVALPGDDSEHPGLHRESQVRGPREVDVEEVWGD